MTHAVRPPFHRCLVSLYAASALISVAASQTIYVDHNHGQANQLLVEQQFLTDTGAPGLLDFDTDPIGPISGNEWESQGFRFVQPGTSGLILRQAGANHTHQSPPGYMFVGSGTGQNSEIIQVHMRPAQQAVGLWIVDSEFAGGGDEVRFYSCHGLEASISMPATGFDTAGPEGNFFVGIDSPNPITMIELREIFGDGDRIGLDRVRFGLQSFGTSICSPAVPNSTGLPGSLRASGSVSVSANELTLTAADLPVGAPGFFLASRTQGFVPNPGGSQGHLCLTNSIARFLSQVAFSGTCGQISAQINLNSIPEPPGFNTAVQAGETWAFQCWHRDANPGTTSNFTDAVEVQFL